MRIKKYCKFLVGIVLVILVFGRLVRVLEANYDGNQALNGLYRLDKNTVDVVFYGSSHVYAGINTVELWDTYGISGYDLAGTMQTLWNSYYNMEETLKYQSPKAMVVDVYGALIEEEYYTSTNVIKNVSSMRFSINKIRNVWSSVPHDEFLSYLLSYPLIHDSYRSIDKTHYVREESQIGGQWYKGFKPSFSITDYDSLPTVTEALDNKVPTEKNIIYLQKMVDLAKVNQIQLAFIVVPYEGWQEEDEAIYSWIEEFARENDVLFLNGNRKLRDMKFDPATDYAEASHLNYSGACKFTLYLGEWLLDNCTLDDHRGEAAYDSWQKYSDSWSSFVTNKELASCSDLKTYIGKLESGEDYIIFISLSDNYKNNKFASLLESLDGIDLNSFENGGTFVVENGEITDVIPNEPEYLWYMETNSLDIAVTKRYDDHMKILVNNEELNSIDNDVTIIVYDKNLDVIADVVAYNSDGRMYR